MGKVNIEGNYFVRSSKEKVTELLSNMQMISKCLKGLEEIKELKENSLSSKIKISEGLVRGIFNLEANLKKDLDNLLIDFKLYGTLGRAEGLITLKLTQVEKNSTNISYKADLEVKGLGATLAKKQISELAEKILKEILDCFNNLK